MFDELRAWQTKPLRQDQALMVMRGEWPKDRVEELKRRWADGETCNQIAQAMPGTTRCSVIGKVHRLGLSPRPHVSGNARPRPKVIPSVPLPKASAPKLPPLLLGMMDLTSQHCRFPYGEGANIRFCGLTPKAGQPYCPDCCARVYQPKHPANSAISEG